MDSGSGDATVTETDAAVADVFFVDTAVLDGNIDDAGRLDLGSLDRSLVDGQGADHELRDRDVAGADAGTDAGLSADAAQRDAGATAQPGFAQPPLSQDASPAWTYVRSHVPFISGLVVSMGEVSPAVINRYFDDFGATAVHTWQDGLGTPVSSWQQQSSVPFVSWTQGNGHSSSNNLDLGGMANTPGRIGYQVGDEPRDQAAFDAMRTGLDVIRRDDPDALVIFNWTYLSDNLLPGFFATSAQDWGVDIFSYDTYSTSRNVYERYAQFAAACRQYDMPCWRYLDSYWDSNHDDDLTEVDMCWDAMTGLVYGYSGHTWFIYQISSAHDGLHSVFFDNNSTWDASPTPKFAWAAAINRDLRVLGESFNQRIPLDARFAYHWPSVPEIGVPFARRMP